MNTAKCILTGLVVWLAVAMLLGLVLGPMLKDRSRND